MNYRNIMIITLFLLIFLTGTVNASDDNITSDTLTIEECNDYEIETESVEDAGEDMLGSESDASPLSKTDSQLNISVSDCNYGENAVITCYVGPDTATGNVTVYVDDKE